MKDIVLRPCTLALVALALVVSQAAPARAQREHLTPEEIEQVRDNQALDARVGVFVKAAERRLRAVSGGQPAEKQSGKETVVAVVGTRAQLLADVAGILDEAVVNIEDAELHAEKSPLIPKALRKLAEACARFLPQLTALRDSTEDERERASLEKSIELAEQIVAASHKLPAEQKKGEQQKKKQ